MVEKYIAISIGSMIVGIIVSDIFFAWKKKKHDAEMADTLIMCLQEQFEYAKKISNKSGIEQTISDKGLKYAIYYYGKISNMLLILKPKDPHISKIEQQLKNFLSVAIKQDYIENKQNSNYQKLKVDKFAEIIEKQHSSVNNSR